MTVESNLPGTRRGRPVIALAVMSLIWGYNWVVMKEGLSYCGPFDFAALRVFFAAICLFGILVWRGDVRPKLVKETVLLGLLSTTLGMGLPMWALASGGAGRTAVLLYTMPFWAMLFAWPILGEKIKGAEWLSVVLAFAGLALIIDFTAVGDRLWSSFIAVGAGIVWAGSAILTKIMRRSPDFELYSVTAWQMLYGMGPLFIIAWLFPSEPIQWTPVFIAALMYNIFLTSVLAFLLWFYVLERLTAGAATMGTLATPVIALIAGAVQLGERPNLKESCGIALILAGIALLTVLGIVKGRQIAHKQGRWQKP